MKLRKGSMAALVDSVHDREGLLVLMLGVSCDNYASKQREVGQLWFLLRTPLHSVFTSAANRLIDEVVQSRRRPLLGPSPG